ncbi:major capsid protein [Capybara microvirus Cap1_SP_137]|nr:major capsid protein [Capybara microvirus Cap1_SP_137]
MSENMIHSFGVNKVERLPRSTMKKDLRNTTAFAQGVLIPIVWDTVIPGSTCDCDFDNLVRLALTQVRPTMGDMYFTYGAYFVPDRILYKNYEKMFGGGEPSEWQENVEYILPYASLLPKSSGYTEPSKVGYDGLVPNSGSYSRANATARGVYTRVGSLADYLGLPLVDNLGAIAKNHYKINLTPFLAYERIWTDFWRDENYQNSDPDLEKAYNLASAAEADNLYLGLHYANRFHDYFSDVLPNTQKGPAVTALGSLIADGTTYHYFGDALRFFDEDENGIAGNLVGNNGGQISGSTSGGTVQCTIDGSNLVPAFDLVQFRQAVQLQRARERNGRVGSRFTEQMLGVFEAHLPNAVAQKAVFLGGNTVRVNTVSVPSTGDEPGKLGAYSAQGNSSSVFRTVFDEPGTLMIVGCVRIKHRYSFGLNSFWEKRRRYDWYDPAFAHISEQPLYLKELNAGATQAVSGNAVFGFKQPWDEYRRPVDLITGTLRNDATADIKSWVFQDTQVANQTPYNFLPENGNEIAAVTRDASTSLPSYQFIGDFKATLKITSVLPLYSIPGFIDHLVA